MPAKEKVPRKSYLLPVFFALLRPPGSASTVPHYPQPKRKVSNIVSLTSLSASPIRKRWKVRNRY